MSTANVAAPATPAAASAGADDPSSPGAVSSGASTAASTSSSPAQLISKLGDELLSSGAIVDASSTEFAALRLERDAMAKQRKELQRKFRNAEKKRKRLLEKARDLSTQDLIDVIALRARKEQKKTAAAAEAGEGEDENEEEEENVEEEEKPEEEAS